MNDEIIHLKPSVFQQTDEGGSSHALDINGARAALNYTPPGHPAVPPSPPPTTDHPTNLPQFQ
ncbi:hypothetical protein J6590_022405 [Homalodisca vitripennis]|nr:hypothetical protein J6590_022405 [Homalodisca vitripennis]